ncbi:MAG TPA: ATP-binding protein [Polyangiaceae bacterium]|jgi:two-component system sensor histidine kinase KdpD|nr:ATP-binding protein [Polyangiaceae bacterium]
MSARRPSELQGIAWGLVALLASTLISHLVRAHAELTDLIMIHLLAVVLIAMRFSMRVSLATAVVSILSFDFLFIPPALVLSFPDLKSIVTFIVMIVVAAVISKLNERLRSEQAASRRSEQATLSLYRLAQDLGSAVRVDQLVASAARHIERAFGAQAHVLLGEAEGSLGVDQVAGLPKGGLNAARRAWSRCESVTESSGESTILCQPLLGLHRPVGILVLIFSPDHAPDDDALRLIVAFAAQLASAIERISLGSAVQHAQVQIETERTRNALLSTVSHDLKTPLSAIIAAGTTLANEHSSLDFATRAELTFTIVEAAERLDGLVTNLLSATRLDSGTIMLTKSVEALDELIGAVLSRFAERLGTRLVKLDVPADLPLLSVDPKLIELVLINLVENALRYTPEETTLYISARLAAGEVVVDVADEGAGILEAEREKVFEKFFRGSLARTNDGGAGLGLMICRAAVRAHGGRILAKARSGGGACIEFSLPVAESGHAHLELMEPHV